MDHKNHAEGTAPDFDLPDQNENIVCLKDFRGRWLVLYFYPKDNTPGCTTEAVEFTQNIKKFEELNACVVGISPDKPESHCGFIEKHSLCITLLCDMDHKVAKKYDAWGLKNNYGKEYEGIIRSTFLISPESNLVHEWKNVKVQGHVEEVLKQLKDEISKA